MKHIKKYSAIFAFSVITMLILFIVALFYMVSKVDTQAVAIGRISNISNSCYVSVYDINTNTPENIAEKVSLGIVILFRGAVFYRVYKSSDHTLVATTEWEFFQAGELMDEYAPRWMENNISLIYPAASGDRWLHADECHS